MAKRKSKKYSYKKKKSDSGLMLLAAAAALLVGFFAIFAYKNQSPMPLTSPTPTMISVPLSAQNNSGESGTAVLTEMNGKVTVAVSLTGFTKGTSQPAHIHFGSCPNPGAIKYPLTDVVNGQSITTINASLSDLKALGMIAVNVHESATQIATYVACGDINF